MDNTRVLNRDGAKNFLNDIDEAIKKKGYEFAATFFSLWKSLKMYGEENDAVKKASDKTMDILSFFFKTLPGVSFGYNGTDIIINDQRLKGKRSGEDYLTMLSHLFTSLYIGEINFSSDTIKSDLVIFCILTRNISTETEGDEKTFKEIEAALSERTPRITITKYDPVEEELPPIIDKPQMARQVYRNLVLDYSDYQKKVQTTQPIPLKKVIRNIQNLADLLADDADDRQWGHLLTLATLNSYQKKYIFTHCANVAVISMAVSIKLGMKKKHLITAGIAAYFHDIGITEGAIRDTEGEHNEFGYAYLSRLNSLNFSMMEAAITASSHHLSFDFYGVPVTPDTTKESPTSTPLEEIIRICDYYDITTKWWPDSPRRPYSRVEAVDKILELTKQKQFAPIATKAFFSTMGIYPAGTILKVKSKPLIAFSLGGFVNTYEPAKVAVLDMQMKFKKIDSYTAQELSHLPAEQQYRVPPSTFKEIVGNFQII